jgi:Tol biopolymer transport system component
MKYLNYLSLMILSNSSCSNNNEEFSLADKTIQISPIPANAKIIFHENNYIYSMDENGGNITQITFDNSCVLEHVAVLHDRTKIVANYWSNPSIGGQSSKLLLYDLTNKTMTNLLPGFAMAGNGGVDWDTSGYIYFAGVSALPYPDPATVGEFKANAGANDIYRIKFDGTGLQNLTNSVNRGEADVSVSQDSRYISYMATNITRPDSSFTEIWKRDIDGSNPQLIFVGGKDRVASVHDPEISPDGNYVVFSRVNNNVAPVFPNLPAANTAHDIIRLNMNNTSDVFDITQPGPISIIPDWKGNQIIFLEITDKTNPPHAGTAIINSDGTGYRLIKNGSSAAKWIPD